LKVEPFDLVIRGGTVVTATDMMRADIGIRAERIAAIAEGLDAGRHEIDARGLLVLPGGVDTHSHIEQLAATGLMNADTFESATRSAAFGGTTTVISFAAQHVGMNLTKVVEDYHRLADKGAVVDYAFHMILADPTEEVLYRQLPPLVREGHSSIKVFMTYDRLRIDDEKLLDVLAAARDNGDLVMVHAENHGMINWMAKRLLSRGYVDPKYHGVAHPRVCETEAFTRLIACAIYGLHPKKGTIAIGTDADIAIWDPDKTVAIDDAMVKDRSGYTPWVGRTITGWPSTVIRRGTIIVENGEILASAGSGRFLARSAGVAAKPTGRDAPEFDLRLNFQAKLR
jgi:dihydroorotase-like cyclic amidohydrolase